MKPLIPIAVSPDSALTSMPLPRHLARSSAPAQRAAHRHGVRGADTPPVIRAGLLQSTLIVLPAEEKVANVFAGDTVDWVFDGGHVASRFISVKPKVANGSTDIHIVSDHGNEYTLSCARSPVMRDPHFDSKVFIAPGDKAAKDRLTQLPVFVPAAELDKAKQEAAAAQGSTGRDLKAEQTKEESLSQPVSRLTSLRLHLGPEERQGAWPSADMARRQVHVPARPVSGDACSLRGEGQESHRSSTSISPMASTPCRSSWTTAISPSASRRLSFTAAGGESSHAGAKRERPCHRPGTARAKPPLRKSMPVVIALVVIVALIGIANISSLLSGNKKAAPAERTADASATPNAQQVSSFETQQQMQARHDAEERQHQQELAAAMQQLQQDQSVPGPEVASAPPMTAAQRDAIYGDSPNAPQQHLQLLGGAGRSQAEAACDRETAAGRHQ